MNTDPDKSKAVSFTEGRVKERIGYFGEHLIPEASSFNPLNAKLNPICHVLALLGAHPILHISRIRVKHLGIIIWNDLNWADHVSYTLLKAWKSLHFIMHVLKKG
jgi:hypothetical protein